MTDQTFTTDAEFEAAQPKFLPADPSDNLSAEEIAQRLNQDRVADLTFSEFLRTRFANQVPYQVHVAVFNQAYETSRANGYKAVKDTYLELLELAIKVIIAVNDELPFGTGWKFR